MASPLREELHWSIYVNDSKVNMHDHFLEVTRESTEAPCGPGLCGQLHTPETDGGPGIPAASRGLVMSNQRLWLHLIGAVCTSLSTGFLFFILQNDRGHLYLLQPRDPRLSQDYPRTPGHLLP